MDQLIVIPSIIKPLTPISPSWRNLGRTAEEHTFGYEGYYWLHSDGFVAISSVEVVEGGHTDEMMPHYHLSISKGNQRRCSSADAQFICAQFGMSDALEDNHVPGGFVRNFFMPVAENQRGVLCPCNDNEPAMLEDKGDFVWRGVTR